MNRTLMVWASGLVLGTASVGGAAFAQAAPGANVKSTAAPAQRQAGPDQQATIARCNSLKGADQKSCQDEVKAQLRAAKAATGGKSGAARTPTSNDRVPALQTQSSAVSATGIAPSTTGPDPTPGTTVVPRK